MPPTPPSNPDERRALALRIKLFIEKLESPERRPTPYVIDSLMKALGRLSAGDIAESRMALIEAERADRSLVLGRWSMASPAAMARLRQRLDAVLQDIGE